jgi:hypothetical protein
MRRDKAFVALHHIFNAALHNCTPGAEAGISWGFLSEGRTLITSAMGKKEPA